VKFLLCSSTKFWWGDFFAGSVQRQTIARRMAPPSLSLAWLLFLFPFYYSPALAATADTKESWHKLSFDSENFVCDEFDNFCTVRTCHAFIFLILIIIFQLFLELFGSNCLPS
jgi:hypothetical protein